MKERQKKTLATADQSKCKGYHRDGVWLYYSLSRLWKSSYESEENEMAYTLIDEKKKYLGM